MGVSSALGSSALLPAGLGFRNTVINGHMRVAQRGTATVSTNDSFPVDRWKFGIGTSGAWTAQQIPSSTTATPDGFDYSLNFTKTTGGTVAVGDYNYFVQYIEGNNCSHFAWGTPNAKTLSLSFWVRSGQVGTFGGSLRNSAANYAYCFSYTVNAINTWEYKTIQITGITGGTWLKNTSAGVALFFDLGSGANARGAVGVATGNYIGASGTSSYPSNTTGGYINFTGVQLEANIQPTPFEQRPIGMELALCQRYFYRLANTSVSSCFFSNMAHVAYTATAIEGTIQHPVPMRSHVVTFATNSVYAYNALLGSAVVVPRAAITAANSTIMADVVSDRSTGSFTTQVSYALAANTAAGYFDVSAEL